MFVVNNLYFILFNLVYILFPGIILLKKTAPTLCDNSIYVRILLSYFYGFGVLILEYYLCTALKILWLFVVFSPIVLVLFWVVNRRLVSRWVNIFTCVDLWKLFSCIVIVVLNTILSYIYTSFRFSGILRRQYVDIPKDFLNHIGLVASLSRGVPAKDLKVSGTTLYYHYFQDLLFGMCENIFKIPAIELVIDCTPIMIGGVLGISLFCFFKKENSKRYGYKDAICTVLKCCFVWVFGGSWGYPLTKIDYQSFSNWNNYHIYTSINACGFATASIICLLVAIKNLDIKSLSVHKMIIWAMLVFVATGIKGPYAIVLVASITCVYLVKILLEKKVDCCLVTFLIVSWISFGLTYLFVIHGDTQYGQSQTTDVRFLLDGTLKKTMIADFKSIGLFNIPYVGYICRILIIILIAFGPVLIYVLDITVDELVRILHERNSLDTYTWILLVMIYIGAIGFAVVDQVGYSQIYFCFVSIVPMLGLVYKHIANWDKNSKRRGVLFLFLVSLFGLHLFITDIGVQINARYTECNQLNNIDVSLDVITEEEVLGLKWLYNNAPSDAIVLTDRLSKKADVDYYDDARFFAYSAISERQMYIEGFSYSQVSESDIKEKLDTKKVMYSAAGEELDQLLKENGIDFVIVSKRLKTQFNPQSENVQLCYDNKDISIFEIVK